MSKSQGSAPALSATEDAIRAAVHRMYANPDHLHVSDPARVEGNVVFNYLDAFDPDRDTLHGLKTHYQRGGLGDTVVKRRLETVLLDLLAPIRIAAPPGRNVQTTSATSSSTAHAAPARSRNQR